MRLLVTTFLALVLSVPAFALELTDQNVQQWMKSYSAVMTWAKTQDKKELAFLENDQAMRDPKFDALFSNAMQGMKNSKIYGDFSKVLKQNGYSNTDEWAKLGDRIMAATLAVELEKQQARTGQSRDQMKQAMEALMNNPNMTAEQKAQMQQMMGMGNQMMDVADNVPAQDKAVIQRNGSLIKQVMDQNAEDKQN